LICMATFLLSINRHSQVESRTQVNPAIILHFAVTILHYFFSTGICVVR